VKAFLVKVHVGFFLFLFAAVAAAAAPVVMMLRRVRSVIALSVVRAQAAVGQEVNKRMRSLTARLL
jgi:hypothetical protein